jgi:hypothetical protein
VLIIGGDWFLGHRGILAHPGGFFHTVLKLALGFLLLTILSSGLTAILVSRNIPAALLNIVWSGGLVAIVLRFLGVW